ncbi:lysozyme [Bosea sp. BK604]|uniref:lysozyme n=1 Tax=Bosea sp. BK604 TaxID=2512180 RepID=UPI00104CBB07|nr:lysozyme [Bosea sp. BK604]TCR65428.1 lysozyme [Bosea sp. BK604]
MSRLKKSAAAAALAATVLGGFEGLRLAAYPDPATKAYPWTVCYGETRLEDGSPVRPGMKFTLDQCKQMLVERADEFADALERCVPSAKEMPAKRYVAHLSLSYNIGTGAYCKSSVARLQNARQTRASCDAFLKWNRAAGVVLPGLTRRRQQERAMCLEGL